MEQREVTKEKMYYIQNGYVGNSVLWWAIDSKGYTTEIEKAGKYPKSEAKKIIERPQDIAWECSYIDNNLKARKVIIDGQSLESKKSLKGRKK